MKIRLLVILLALVFLMAGCPRKSKQPAIQEPAAAETNAEENGGAWEVSEPLMENPTEDAPLEIGGGLVQDAGVVLSGAKKHLVIPLKNTSDKPLWLYSIDADCSCTNVDGIPGGQKIMPGEEWPMRIMVDAGRIADGPFEKNLIVTPTRYKPLRIKIKGVVEGFVRCAESKARKMKFGPLKSADEQWSASINLTGFGSAEKILELGMPKEEHKKIDFKLEKTGEGCWRITATPKAPLPYASNFLTSVNFPVLKPENYPPVAVSVEGAVGATLRWEGDHKVFLRDKDFDEKGNAHIAYQIGHDVNGGFVYPKKTQKRIDAIISKVDWKKLYDTLEIAEVPEVQITKKFTEQGVRMDVVLNKALLLSKQRVLIKSGCNGNWEFAGILIKYKAPNDTHKEEEEK